MGKVKICSKQAGVSISSIKPSFKYNFKNADEPLEVEESHTSKILNNKNFYRDIGKIMQKAPENLPKNPKTICFKEELEKIKGIGKKTVKDILKVYKTKKQLKEAIKNKVDLPFRDDVSLILKNTYQ